MMECMYCKGKMAWATAPLSVDRSGYHIYWQALPAWVCSQCGEAYFEADTVTGIQRILRAMDDETFAEIAVDARSTGERFVPAGKIASP